MKLIAQVGEHEGREIAIDAPEFVIGRDPSCQLRINHAYVDRRHCRILHDGGRVLIEDLGSTMGTEINGRLIRSAEVRDGDRLQVGMEQFQLVLGTESGKSGRREEIGIAHPPMDDLVNIELSRLDCDDDAPQSLNDLLDTELSRLLAEDEIPLVAIDSACEAKPSIGTSDELEPRDDFSVMDRGRAPVEYTTTSYERRPDPTLSDPRHAPPAPVESAPVPSKVAVSRRVRLRVLVGKERGRFIEVSRPRFLIGRDPSCQIRAHSKWVSRVHASIEQRGDRVFVRDLGSTNGTFLDGRRLQDEEVEVADGARLEVGPLEFCVVLAAGSVGRVPERPGPWTELFFTCAIQPGSDDCLFPDIDPAREPVRPRLALHHHFGELSGTFPHAALRHPPRGAEGLSALESLLQEFLRALGHGGSDHEAMATPAPSIPKPAAIAPQTTPRASILPDLVTEPDLPTTRSADTPPSSTDRESLIDHELQFDAFPEQGPDGPAPDLPPPVEHHVPPEVDPPIPLGTRSSPPGLRPRELELDFECPGCGTSGRAPVSRLGHQLSCHVCASTFYIGKSGEIAVGTHPQRPPSRHNNPSRRVHTQHKPGLVAGLNTRWEELSRGRKIGASVLLLLIFVLAGWFVTGPLLLESPRARTFRAIEAVVHNQEKQLEALSVPTTSSHAIQWMRLVAPILKPQIERGAQAEVQVLSQSREVARTNVKVLLDTTHKATRLTLFWVRNPRGGWLLEGLGTFQNASALLKSASHRPNGRPQVSSIFRQFRALVL